MTNFGWSYPAGCSGVPADDEGPCEVCGLDPFRCICPECPECSVHGDPNCYKEHGLVLTEEQRQSRQKYEANMEAEARAEAEWAEAEAAANAGNAGENPAHR